MYKTVVKLHSSYLPLALPSLQTVLCCCFMTSSGRIGHVLLSLESYLNKPSITFLGIFKVWFKYLIQTRTASLNVVASHHQLMSV